MKEKKGFTVPVNLNPNDGDLTSEEKEGLSKIMSGFNKLKFVEVNGLEYGVTPLEALMLQKIARNEYTQLNGAEPETTDDTCTYADVIMETPQDKGVFTSLLKKGLVLHWDYRTPQDRSARENLCRLSDIGFVAYKKLFPQPKDPQEEQDVLPENKG
jgi:hypothetical protein